eukprot:TRINITY_DN2013_c0_g4_i1.p1 TRINITY_DN2013_c0_g4~~TRINITY_DN2013_c0_g4_i1.p1  ORF type:complete len:183 (-),score=35.18 TRINITY_DN2013_c0_g4_i1:672-1220(-)
MGILLTKLWQLFWQYDKVKVIVVGLNNAGKTTTLYKLLLGEVVVTQPTIGSNVEEIEYKNAQFQMWDIGGQESLRTSWSTYYSNTHIVILVIDSTDKERLPIVKDELGKMLTNQELNGTGFLVLANKQDLKGALSAAEISDILNLHNLKDHEWHIQACCALTGEGLTDGLDWIINQMKRKKR